MSSTITLVKLDRNYHKHEHFHSAFYDAYEKLEEDVELWKATTGVQVNLEVIETQCNTFGTVTAVTATFDTDTDLAMYQMLTDHKMSTEITVDEYGDPAFSWR